MYLPASKQVAVLLRNSRSYLKYNALIERHVITSIGIRNGPVSQYL